MATLIIHQRNSLVCYSTDRDAVETIQIPKEAVTDMEVMDEKIYTQAVMKKFGNRLTHQTVPTVLVMADDLCFTVKAVSEKLEEQKQKLVSSVPFAHVETVTLQNQTEFYLVATNADLYETAVRAFAESGYRVTFVVPWRAILQAKLSLGGEVDRVTVKRIFDAQIVLKGMSFPLAEPEQVTEVSVKDLPTKGKPSLAKGWIVFGVIALLYAVGMLWFMLRK